MANSGGSRMDYNEVRDYAGKFSKESSDLQASVARMYQYVSRLEQTWDGAEASAFRARLDSLKKNFEQTYQVIEEISTKLKSSADDQEQREQERAQKW